MNPQGHHEIGPQTSYRKKKTTILPHFSSPESWYHSFREIMNIKASKFALQTSKIRFFRPSKLVFQTFKIRASDLQNSRFKAPKFALQGSKK